MHSIPKLAATTAISLAVATVPLYAQDDDVSSSEDQAQTSATTGTDGGASSTKSMDAGSSDGAGKQGSDQKASSEESAAQEGDALVVSVGDTDFTRADVTSFISELPPQMRQRPSEMLVPMAVKQMIARELILTRAMEQDLDQDPEVIALVEERTQDLTEAAMVQTWLDRELSESVTEDEVRAEYEEIKSSSDKDLPPFEDVRAQIEQKLRQQELAGLQEYLREDVEITYYGPDGEPRAAGSANADKENADKEKADKEKTAN